MKETAITRQIMQSWKRVQPLLWWHKIPDSRYGCETGPRAVDVIACWCGTLVGFEFKILTNRVSMAFDRVRESQLTTLEEIESAGGVGFLVIVVYYGPRNKCAYAIPVSVWRKCVGDAKDVGCRSVPMSEFADCMFEQKYEGGQLNWQTEKIQERVDVTIDKL